VKATGSTVETLLLILCLLLPGRSLRCSASLATVAAPVAPGDAAAMHPSAIPGANNGDGGRGPLVTALLASRRVRREIVTDYREQYFGVGKV